MKPAIAVQIFIVIWLGIVGLVCIVMLLAAFAKMDQIRPSSFSPMFLIPFGMFIFGYLLMIIAFKLKHRNPRHWAELPAAAETGPIFWRLKITIL